MTAALRGKWALVTGASSGIGAALARQLAARGANVVITARREDRLAALAAELRTAHGVEVDVVASDLSAPDAAEALFTRATIGGRVIDVLINNAGFGTCQPFADQPWARAQQELRLNVLALAELCHRFAAPMRARRAGHIMNVASIGAFLPTPRFASYGAGKAYVRNFSEALAYELAPSGVRVLCLCPGATETEFSDVAGVKLNAMQRLAFMSAERCARIGLGAMLRGRRVIVSGFANSVGMWLLRFVPRRLAAWIADKAL